MLLLSFRQDLLVPGLVLESHLHLDVKIKILLNMTKFAGKYRVTILFVQNLPLTSDQKFRFGLACLGLARPKRNFSFEVNRRF